MAALYEHNLLGSKICMVNANFNIPFLSGDGNISLYESGIILLDEHGNEKYMIELEQLDIKYEKFINVRNLKYISNIKINRHTIDKRYRHIKNVLKRVNGNFYGKCTISISSVGDIILLDNQFFKYRSFYEKILSLKDGNSPLNISKTSSKNSILEFLKSKFFTRH